MVRLLAVRQFPRRGRAPACDLTRPHRSVLHRHSPSGHFQHGQPRSDHHPRHWKGPGALHLQVRRRLRIVCHASRGLRWCACRPAFDAFGRDKGVRKYGICIRADRHWKDAHDGRRSDEFKHDGSTQSAARSSSLAFTLAELLIGRCIV